MDTITTRTRTDLLTAANEVRNAGGTTTHMLATIARMLTPADARQELDNNLASVRDTASFHFAALSSAYERTTGATPYPPDASVDNLTSDDETTITRRVVNEFGALDETDALPAPEIVLAENLLHCLRKAAALKVEYGPHFGPVYTSVRESLVTLLGTQSVERKLAIEAIDHALINGKGIAAAVAYTDSQR